MSCKCCHVSNLLYTTPCYITQPTQSPRTSQPSRTQLSTVPTVHAGCLWGAKVCANHATTACHALLHQVGSASQQQPSQLSSYSSSSSRCQTAGCALCTAQPLPASLKSHTSFSRSAHQTPVHVHPTPTVTATCRQIPEILVVSRYPGSLELPQAAMQLMTSSTSSTS